MRMQTPREFYIPPRSTKVAHKHSDAVVYLYLSATDIYGAMGFRGKASKPSFHYTFKTSAKREAFIVNWLTSCANSDKARLERRAARHQPARLQLGHVFYTSWGYDQTNLDFYQVTAMIGRRTVELRKVKQIFTGENANMSGYAIPAIDDFCGAPFRALVQYGDTASIDGHHGTLWDGKPKYWSAYH